MSRAAAVFTGASPDQISDVSKAFPCIPGSDTLAAQRAGGMVLAAEVSTPLPGIPAARFMEEHRREG